MSKLLLLLRDPAWQAIGAIIAMLTIFFSTAPSTNTIGSYSVIHWKKENFSDKWLPSDSVKLLVKGSKQELDKAVIDYYLINNSTDRPILISDYASPLAVKKGAATNKILVVESCTKSFSEQCSYTSTTQASGSYVPFDWKEQGNKWIAAPSLLNPGDSSCVIIVSEAKDNNIISGINRFEWNARVANIHLRVFDTSDEFHKKQAEKTIFDYISTSIRLDGVGVYWFVLLQCVFFTASIMLLVKANCITGHLFNDIRYALVAMLLATSSSEILVDIFINKNENLHAIVWPMLIAHSLFVMFYSYQSLKSKSQTSVSP